MKALPPEQNEISECRLSFRGVLGLLLVTGLYFGSFFYLPQNMRYMLMAAPVLITLLLFRPEPGFWLPFLPLLLIAGGSTKATGEFNPAAATIIMIVFTLLYIADRVFRNKTLFIPSTYLFWLFIAILIQVCSVFVSIHVQGQHIWNAMRDGSSIYLFFPLAIIIPVICTTRVKFDQLLRAMMLTLLVASAIGILQYIMIKGFSRVDLGLGYLYKGRVASVFIDNPNAFAAFLELSIPLSIVLFFREKGMWWKITAAVAVVLGVSGVLFTFSRGGLLGVFLGCGITLLYIFRSKVWIPIIIGVLAAIFLVMNTETFDRQMSFFMNPQAHLNQPTILHRYISYSGFFDQIAEYPVTGIGWGAREFYWGRTLMYSFWEVRHCISTSTILEFGGLNSLFLNHAVKGGVISLASVVLMFGTIFAACFRAFRKGGGMLAVALTAGLLSFMIHQIIGNQLRLPAINAVFWIIAGLLLTLVASNFGRSEHPGGKS